MYRVLLVDDEYMIVNGLKKLISWQEYGYEVVGTAANGEEALAYVRKNPIDLVVVDVNMPVLSGIEFVAKAREEGIPFRFIMLSGYQEFQYVKDTLKLGTENYLLKPVNKAEMVETLQMVTKALKQDEQDERDQGYLAEYFILSWIHGDIIYSDLSTYLLENNIDVLTENYTVIFIKRGPDEMQIQDYLIQENQPLIHYALEIDMWLLVYLGDKMPLKIFTKKMKAALSLSDADLVVGETVVDMKEVPSSYDSALSSSRLHEFYDFNGLKSSEVGDVDARGALPSISFVEFNKALSLRDFETIQGEIEIIFAKLRAAAAKPDYTRHIIFLIFIDLYRQFEGLSEEFYQNQAEKITSGLNFEELEPVIWDTIEEIRSSKGRRIYSQHVQDVIEIVQEEYHLALSLKEIAGRIHMNTMYLGQLFKKETNKSFSQYLHQYRIKRAQSFLVDTGMTISEIAEKTGYTSAGYFYKSFKKICGISPKEFREEYQANFNPIE